MHVGIMAKLTVIQGPPGTGKSTVAAAIAIFGNSKCIIVTWANATADTLATKTIDLIEKYGVSKVVIRSFAKSRERFCATAVPKENILHEIFWEKLAEYGQEYDRIIKNCGQDKEDLTEEERKQVKRVHHQTRAGDTCDG